jgi:hypothetical protein
MPGHEDSTEPTRDGSRAPVMLALVLAVTALGRGLQDGNGTGTPLAIQLLTVALLLTLVAVLRPPVARGGGLDLAAGWLRRRLDPVLRVVLGACLAYQLGQFFSAHPGVYLKLAGPWPYGAFHGAIALAAMFVGVCLASDSKEVSFASFLALLALHLGIGFWIVRTSPAPFIDVWVWHREAFVRLSHGVNPYVPPMPNIYDHGLFYAPGAVQGKDVLVGFPYPPMELLLAGIGHLLGGDYRYAQVVAITASAALFALARPGRLAFGAAALLLFTPRGFIVIEQGFSDPFALMLVALVALVADRRPRWVPYLLGVVVATKQYLIFALPLAPLLFFEGRFSWRRWSGWMVKASLAGLATCLPFFLWSPKDFLDSVLIFQAHQPFRDESLSYVGWWAKQGGSKDARLWLTFGVTAPLTALALWRSPRTTTGFLSAVGLVVMGFFALSKQAFSNYYFNVIGLLAGAAASCQPDPTKPET